jgi:hypothetical protein
MNERSGIQEQGKMDTRNGVDTVYKHIGSDTRPQSVFIVLMREGRRRWVEWTFSLERLDNPKVI